MTNPHNHRIQFAEEDVQIFKKHNCNNLLEVFFADGRNIIKFKNEGFHVEGIDDGHQQHNNYSEIGTQKAKEEGIKTLIAPVFDAKLPYDTNSFEGIYAWHYVNHNYKNSVLKLFKEIYRILKPEGIFSLRFTKMEDFNYKLLENDLAETIESEEELAHGFKPEKIKILGPQTFSRFVEKESGIPHYAYYKEELQKDLKEIGFDIVDMKSVLWNWHVWCKK